MTIIAMSIIDCLRGVRYHCPHLSGISVEEYADCLAYDCINNHYKTTSVSTTRGHLNADALDLDNGTSISGGPQSQNLNFLMPGLQDQLHGMLLNACGATNPSPLSTAESLAGSASSGRFAFGATPSSTVPSNCHQHHDTMLGKKKNQSSGRPALRRCVVCGHNTGNECTHPRCKSRTSRDGALFGVYLCPLKTGTREGFDKPCLAIHRESEA